MKRNLKAPQGESDENKSNKDKRIADGEDDDLKELAQEPNEKKGFGESIHQTLANILEAKSQIIWKNERWNEYLHQARKL